MNYNGTSDALDPPLIRLQCERPLPRDCHDRRLWRLNWRDADGRPLAFP